MFFMSERKRKYQPIYQIFKSTNIDIGLKNM